MYFVSSLPLGTITKSGTLQNVLGTLTSTDFGRLSDQGQIDTATHPDFSTGGAPVILGLAHRDQLGNNTTAKSLTSTVAVVYWMVVIDHEHQ
jgi:hypothetical protein